MTRIHDHGQDDAIPFDLTGFEALAHVIRKHTRSSQLAAAHEAANEGMQRALDAAERRDIDWPDAALSFLHNYARTHAEFTMEEATAEANRLGYGSPSDERAWGSIVRRAAIRGYIRNTHRTRPRIKGHGSPGIIWLSLVYLGDVA
jgi:hypothetical protein